MTATHALTFLWTPWSAGLSVAVVAVAVVLCAAAWHRSGYARTQGLLELFRLIWERSRPDADLSRLGI